MVTAALISFFAVFGFVTIVVSIFLAMGGLKRDSRIKYDERFGCDDIMLETNVYDMHFSGNCHIRNPILLSAEDIVVTFGPQSNHWRQSTVNCMAVVDRLFGRIKAVAMNVIAKQKDAHISLDTRHVVLNDVSYFLFYSETGHQCVAKYSDLFIDVSGDGRIETLDDVFQHYGSTKTTTKTKLSFVPDMQLPQKNWAPFVHNNSIHFITRLNPLQVVRYDADDKSNESENCTVVVDVDPSWSWQASDVTVRGGSQLVEIGEGLFLGAGHTAGEKPKWNSLTTYRCVMYIFDASVMRIKKMSKPVNISPVYPDLGLSRNDYVRVHFPVDLTRARNGDWILGLDIFDSVPLLIRIVEGAMNTFLKDDVDNDFDYKKATQEIQKEVSEASSSVITSISCWFSWLKFKRKH